MNQYGIYNINSGRHQKGMSREEVASYMECDVVEGDRPVRLHDNLWYFMFDGDPVPVPPEK